MKLTRKEKEYVDAYRWMGKNTDDFYNFINDNRITDTVVDVTYSPDTNQVILIYTSLYGGAVVNYGDYIVYDDGIEVLTESQLNERYNQCK